MVPDWLVWVSIIIGIIGGVIAINDKVRSWFRDVLGHAELGKTVAAILSVLGVIVVCAALVVGARAVFNAPPSSGNNNSQSISSNESTDTPIAADTPTPSLPRLTIQSFRVDRTSVPILSYVNFTVTFNRTVGDQDGISLQLYAGNSFDCSNRNVCMVGLVAPSPLTKTLVAELVDSNGLSVYTFPSSITVTWSAPEPANPADDLPCTSSNCAEIEN